jgi:putative membrane protein
MSIAFAHGLGAETDGGGIAWTTEPSLVLPLVILAVLYLLGARRLADHGATSQGRNGVLFWSGFAILTLTLVSPLHEFGLRVFSAHMVEHELLMIVAVPLIVAARPGPVLLWGVPAAWRRSVGRLGHRLLARPWALATELWSATIVHAVVLWLWHAPALFQAALDDETMHIVQHLSFIVSAIFFWTAVLRRDAERRGQGAAVLALFLTSLQAGLLGALLTFSQRLWYPFAVDPAPFCGLTRGEDQALAGLIMWIPACSLYVLAALVIMARWLSDLQLRHV